MYQKSKEGKFLKRPRISSESSSEFYSVCRPFAVHQQSRVALKDFAKDVSQQKIPGISKQKNSNRMCHCTKVSRILDVFRDTKLHVLCQTRLELKFRGKGAKRDKAHECDFCEAP